MILIESPLVTGEGFQKTEESHWDSGEFVRSIPISSVVGQCMGSLSVVCPEIALLDVQYCRLYCGF